MYFKGKCSYFLLNMLFTVLYVEKHPITSEFEIQTHIPTSKTESTDF